MEKYGWEPIGTITTALTALTNQQRHVRGIGSVVTIGTNAIELDLSIATAEFAEMRLLATGTDADINIAEVYAARGDDDNDDYTHVGQLTATVGTMISRGGTRLYHDTMTWAATDEGFEVLITNSGNNDTAKAWFNTNGYRKILIVVSTLASTSITAEIAFVDRIELPSTPVNDLTVNSASGGEEQLTISSNVAVGANQACKSCLVTWFGTGPVYKREGATATVNSFRLPTESGSGATVVGSPIAYPVRNTNQLNFYSGTDGDTINLDWRS
ncbi:MAG TPA: hypothetical protein ENH62_02460 [Marinobacter sp.]|uniref:Uncharacterized protein n=1 Tax=marine sediment metagenome TaxID=412755 RepID=A0A0F9VFQ7_9ZZZZ|nr:hypothetical protein [Marinobacter sp.]